MESGIFVFQFMFVYICAHDLAPCLFEVQTLELTFIILIGDPVICCLRLCVLFFFREAINEDL